MAEPRDDRGLGNRKGPSLAAAASPAWPGPKPCCSVWNVHAPHPGSVRVTDLEAAGRAWA